MKEAQVERKLKDYLASERYRPATFKELVQELSLKRRKEVSALNELLREMLARGEIKKNKRGRFVLQTRSRFLKGTIEGHPRGFAFLIPEDRNEPDVFIGPSRLRGSMHGDQVLVKLLEAQREGKSREGEVVKILKRRDPYLTGSYHGGKRKGMVTPDDPRFGRSINIKKKKGLKPSPGDKVVVEITRWPERGQDAQGRIDQVLGREGDVGVDVLTIVKKHGLKEGFPSTVLKEAGESARRMEGALSSRRLDLRELPMVTIDPEDARDLDDAVSLEKLPQGGWRLGVHIADVSYFVPEGSLLDREAFERGTSIYLVDRVLPMLPPKLSNDVCSLNPGVERLAISVFIELDPEGEIRDYSFHQSIIAVDKRLSYRDVAAALQKEDAGSHGDFAAVFLEMHSLASLLKEKRVQKGAIDFEFPEPKIRLDEEGQPVEIEVHRQGPAESIIEEFMILCNEVVAGHFEKLSLPFVYRIHERPLEAKFAELRDTLSLFNIRVSGSPDKVKSFHYQKILERARGSRYEMLVNYLLLRSLTQARYSTENLGHFGLSSPAYTHFTSPIRRYPDLVVHRLLRYYLEGALDEGRWQKLAAHLPRVALHSSEQERLAVEAERETIDLKKVEYMEGREGEEFEAVINGVTSFGFFVELANTVEGLVPVSSLTDDYYRFHEKTLTLRGGNNRDGISPG